MNMNTVASNPPPEKLTKKKKNLNNKLKVKPKDVNNVKNNRNRKQKSHSRTEDQESTKGGWWQKNVNKTPFPGKYSSKLYAQEGLLNPVQSDPVKRTFNFERKEKSSSSTPASQSGAQLTKSVQSPLPLTEVGRNTSPLRVLRSTNRQKIMHPVPQKDNLSVQSYNFRSPLFEKPSARFSKGGFFSPTSQGSFRSSVKRFPTIYFVPKEGPAPGHYNVKDQTLTQITSSPFQSKVPRFLPSTSKTPGPGAYETVRQVPSWTKASPRYLYY
ncbi:protein STPG4 [Rhinoraja longicauda]